MIVAVALLILLFDSWPARVREIRGSVAAVPEAARRARVVITEWMTHALIDVAFALCLAYALTPPRVGALIEPWRFLLIGPMALAWFWATGRISMRRFRRVARLAEATSTTALPPIPDAIAMPATPTRGDEPATTRSLPR